MDKYIKYEDIQKCRFFQDEEGEWILHADIIKIPAADVMPIRYGCWNADKEDVEWGNCLIRYRCSVCKKRPLFDKEEYKFILSPYCPNCGAKMDKDGDRE